MVVDTSAILAILLGEPEADAFIQIIGNATQIHLSAANWLEAATILESRKGSAGVESLRELIRFAKIVICPVTIEHSEAALNAFRRFGKGRHPARLNFGDCLAYGLAKQSGFPLLFKGNDFGQTDISPVALHGTRV